MSDLSEDELSHLPEKEADLIRRIQTARKANQPAKDMVALYTEQANYYLEQAMLELAKTGPAKVEGGIATTDSLSNAINDMKLAVGIETIGTEAAGAASLAQKIVKRTGELPAAMAALQESGNEAALEANKAATKLLEDKADAIDHASVNMEYPDSVRLKLLQAYQATHSAAHHMPDVKTSTLQK